MNTRSWRYQALTESQATELHAASLEIMERTGVRVFEDEALTLLRSAGVVATDGNRVRIPARLVEWALTTVPKCVEVYDQLGRPALQLDGRSSYFGVGSDCTHIYDIETGQRRLATINDVAQGVRLADALPNVDFIMSMFLPSDAPQSLYEQLQFEVMLLESTKPIVFVGVGLQSTIDVIAMAEPIVGGSAALEDRPFIVNYVNSATALRHNHESVQRLLFGASRGIPTIYLPGLTRGVTSPLTEAAVLALGNAGQLVGLVLSQLKRPGSPFIRSSPHGDFDMRSMIGIYAAPERGSFGLELARHYGLPVFGTGGCSDSKLLDGQAVAEAALTLFANAIGGASLIHDIGYLDCATTGSLELVAVCDTMIGWIRRWQRPLLIDSESLCLDLIDEVGPDGQFTGTHHTLRHVRDDWRPVLFDRTSWVRWAANGASTLEERTRSLVRRILADHCRTPPLSGETRAAVSGVLRAAAERGTGEEAS